MISEFLFFDCDDCALKFDTFQPVRGGMLLLFFFLLLLHAKMLASRQGIGHANGQELLTTLIRLASAARSSNVISHQPKWADYETYQRGVVVSPSPSPFPTETPLHLPSWLNDCILAIKITFGTHWWWCRVLLVAG